jgi:hypothetical protein
MAREAQDSGGRRWNPWRIAAWSFAAFLVLLPLAAMQLTDEVNWTGFDFLFASVLIGGVGVTFELTVRVSRNHAYRAAVGFALAATFLTIWVNGAVGMIGSEGNPYNLLFGGVLILALVGAIVARFEPAGMARAMAAAAVAQAAVAAFGLSADALGAVLSMAFAGPWLLAAALFRRAAREQAPAGATSPG